MRKPRGLTLVEVLIGTALLVVGGGALLVGIRYTTIHADYLSQCQVAMNAAQGLLEQLAATDFSLLTGGQYGAAFAGAQRCWLEDLNCNGAQDAGEEAFGTSRVSSLLGGGTLDLQIRQPADDAARNPDNPALLDLHVAACWQSRGRAIGEDRNCNGVLDSGEDANTNGWIDSPVMVSTRVGRMD